MDKVNYFHRNKEVGYSIYKVFEAIIPNIHNKEEFFLPRVNASIIDIIKNLRFVFKYRDKTCINHVTGDVHYCILALFGCNSVLTVHDTVLLDYHRYPLIKRILIKYLYYILPLKYSNHVTCISYSTKERLKKYTNRKDIEVIYNSIARVDTNISREYIVKDKYDVLNIGTKDNKNLENVIPALNGLPVCLHIVGRLSQKQKKILYNNRIDYTEHIGISDAQLLDLYEKCDLNIFCSLFEGFGMPIIEANRSGCPCLCSSIDILKEIAGESAEYADPYDINDIQNKIKYLLSNPERRQNLACLGYKNVERFYSDTISQRWIEYYSKISNK